MRVAMTFPHSLGAPGGGTQDCSELARNLARAGAEVTLFAVGSLGPTRFPRPRLPASWAGAELAESLRRDGVTVVSLERQPLHHLLDGLRVKRALAGLLEQGPLDAVLGYWSETCFLRALARERGVVFAMNAAASHTPLFRPEGRPAAWPRRLRNEVFLARPLRQADVVFARSEFTRREVIELAGVDPAKVEVVHLGVDPSFFGVQRVENGPIRRLFFFGNLVAEKGLFDALAALQKLGPDADWRLRIAGWGDRERVEQAAREHGIEGRIELLGRLDRPALQRELAEAQVAVLPSHTESFGLANAEAQAAGLPVVAYDVAAVPEVIEDGKTGWLVPLKDLDGLARAIREAMHDPRRTFQLGLAGRERMKSQFSWEQAARKTLDGLAAAQRRAKRAAS
jgi:glycosyltransferase involved in cell wall biosynthesis